jgi:hypothetical protein
MNLTRFETEDGVELVINENGESFATVRGYARLSGRSASTISRRLKGVASELTLEAEVLTPGGLQGVALIAEDVIADWIVKDNPTLARAMLKAGIRAFLHTAAGYQVTSNPIAQQPIPTPAELPVVMPTEQELDYMRSRAWEKAEMMGSPVSVESVKQKTGYRRAIDVVQSLIL